MAATIHTPNAKTEGGTPRERLALKLLWLTSWIFYPLQFRGFWRITRILCGLMEVKERQWVMLPNGLRFSIDLRDPYWNRLISPKFEYEPELHHLLAKLKGQSFAFIDCGANMGYWSCLLNSDLHGTQKVYSIEPLSSNFKLLQSHLNANNLNGTLYHNAVSETGGESLTLYKPGGHASVSLVADANAETAEKEIVETVTLDDLLTAIDGTQENILIKLDVEGVEIEALKGAKELLKKKPLIFYEDHAQDTESKISDYVLNELGLEVLFIADDGAIQPMGSVAAINAIKTDITRGYNFLAYDKTAALMEEFGLSEATETKAEAA